MSDLYVFTGHGTCRSCDAPILWFRTPAGKNMPVDDRKEVLPGRPPLVRGDTVTREDGKEGLLPFAHWGTCPDATKHRKEK